MNILLLGIMGSGKTTTGKALAQNLEFKFIEQDEQTLERCGLQNSSQLSEQRQTLWKEAELEVSKDLSFDIHQVVACSGSVVENELNLLYFQENSKNLKIIYLYASPETLVSRVASRYTHLPDFNLEPIQFKIQKMFARRDLIYRDFANLIIDTGDNTLEKNVDLIQQQLR